MRASESGEDGCRRLGSGKVVVIEEEGTNSGFVLTTFWRNLTTFWWNLTTFWWNLTTFWWKEGSERAGGELSGPRLKRGPRIASHRTLVEARDQEGRLARKRAEAEAMADNGPPKVKVLIIGASGVGKTCLLTRFCDEVTPSSTISTIGIDFKTKVVKVDGTAMRLLVYDTAGQEKYRTITSSFYRGSAGVVLVYDVTDEASFHSISELWMPRLEELSGKNVSKVLVGNKIDKEAARTVPTRLGEGLADEFGIPFFETSAMTGDGVENAFLHLAAAIKARVLDPVAEQRATADDPAVILTGIAGDSGGRPQKSGCC